MPQRLLTQLRRPLISINTAMSILDCDEHTVECLIQTGLLHAVDIRAHGACRACVRILARSVIDHQNYLAANMGHLPNAPSTSAEAEIIDLLPKTRETMRGVEVARFLNCSAWHVVILIRAGELTCGSRRKPKESAAVHCQSVANFLTRRIMS